LTPFALKENTVLDTPLFVFDCTFGDGTVYHWCTHHVTVEGAEYSARIMKTNVFEMQSSSDGGIDTIPKITFELANADGLMSEIQRTAGFKGAALTVKFVFFDLKDSLATSDVLPVFQGLLDMPESITENAFRVSAINRLALQRIALPPVSIQKRCPWSFPATLAQRQEAVDGGTKGVWSQFYKCGYSAGAIGGVGNLNSGAAFTSCDYSRIQCEQRGMFSVDSQNRATARFGGIEYVPSVISVRAAGEKGTQLSPLQDNEARYNDYVPLVYGTGWYMPDVVFARNDGNLTHMEVLLGMGPMTSVTTVLVNDIEIPVGIAGKNMTGTGWYNVVSYGTRNGVFNRDFADSTGSPLGDPYGSMAYLSVVVPNGISDGRTMPQIQVLVNGLQIETFSTSGVSNGFRFNNNPVWVILDILRRCGWNLTEIDMASFASSAAYCDQPIQITDLNGNTISTPRYQCNLILQNRRSAGDVIRGIRVASCLYLTYSSAGLLQMNVENTLALQQPQQAPSSNATAQLNGGWPVYEFGDGLNGTTGIARKADQSSSLRVFSRTSADTPNRFTLEFQDAFNSYQQDSVTLVDPDDVAKCGFEVSATPNALGLPNYDQATRIVALCLKKSIEGNLYIEFETSVRALGIKPGDIIAVTYAREGMQRTPFRVVKVVPGQNYRAALIRAQLHDDGWYTDTTNLAVPGATAQSSYRVGVPRPILGTTPDASGTLEFGISESSAQAQDGTMALLATIAGSVPPGLPVGAPNPPVLSLSPTIAATGGTLGANTAFYYAVTGVDASNVESACSFTVLAVTSAGTATYSVTLNNMSLPPSATGFNVYRGTSPMAMSRIYTASTRAGSFTDTGYANTAQVPPDPNFDHANFYWRLEAAPEAAATIFSHSSIGNLSAQMQANQYAGMTVRIISGMGAGQERIVSSNSSTTLAISPLWMIAPDASSSYVISQTAYQLGASGSSSQVQFEIPNLAGRVVQICGRSANACNVESPYELATVTRWTIGGAGSGALDSAVPPAPNFNLAVLPELGGLQLSGVSFTDAENTRTISLGTLTLYSYNEGSTVALPVLSNAIGVTDTTVAITTSTPFSFPAYLALGTEIVRLTGKTADGSQYTVDRALHATTAVAHTAQSAALMLKPIISTVPFAEDFFSNYANANWSQSITIANARICSAEFYVTNSRGNSPVASQSYTSLTGGGLRTLTGGQIMLQIPGTVAIQNSAVPPLDPGATYAVNNIYAYVGTAPTASTAIGLTVTMQGQPYCTLSIPAGSTQSALLDGSTLAPLQAGQQIGLNVTSVGDTTPGSDLTVVIRV
jgi:hypothetical protein